MARGSWAASTWEVRCHPIEAPPVSIPGTWLRTVPDGDLGP